MLVWSSFLVLQCSGGPSGLPQKLALLTMATTNVLFVALVFFANRSGYLITFLTFLAVWFSAETQAPMALTNSLFIVHPVMLYASVALTLYNAQRRRLERNFYGVGFLLFCSITLGGVWSMQELNWGGWWNWDVLELGALHLWIVAWASTHFVSQKSSKLRDFKKHFALSLASAYYLLNKSGFATSIHSFVTSPSLRLNALSAAAALFGVSTLSSIPITAAACSAGFVYSGVIEANALKVVLVGALALAVFSRRRTRTRHAAAHAAVTCVAASFLLLNFNNSAVSLVEATRASGSCVSANNRLTLKVARGVFVWDAGWFSKPNVSAGSVTTFSQSRSANGNTTALAYRK